MLASSKYTGGSAFRFRSSNSRNDSGDENSGDGCEKNVGIPQGSSNVLHNTHTVLPVHEREFVHVDEFNPRIDTHLCAIGTAGSIAVFLYIKKEEEENEGVYHVCRERPMLSWWGVVHTHSSI